MGAKLIKHGRDEVVFVLRPSSSNVAALREGGLKCPSHPTTFLLTTEDQYSFALEFCAVVTGGQGSYWSAQVSCR